MFVSIIAVTVTAIVFVALISKIAKNHQSKSSGNLTGTLAIIASFAGLFIYGWSYSMVLDNLFLAMIKALLATLGMFLGKNEYNDIKGVDIMQYVLTKSVFWMIHLLALYATTNAVLATIGAHALKKIRLFLRRRRKKIFIIYGINKNSISFANELSETADNFIVFVDKHIESNLTATLNESGFVYFADSDAVSANERFVKNILGINKKKKINIYVLGNIESENFDYAVALRDTFEKIEIPTANIKITLLANMEMRYGEALQAFEDKYGYGSVMIIDKAYLAAHALITEYPPCNYVEFDTNTAKAVEGEMYNAAIIGFGKIGQAVLKALVKNGQFEGSQFKITIFDPNHSNISGYLYKNSGPMMDNYDIEFLTEDAREKAFYEFVEKNSKTLDCVIVCTGDEERNAELAEDIQSTLVRFDGRAEVFQCSYDNVIHFHNNIEGNGSNLSITKLYTIKNMDIEYADNLAMHLNHAYCRGESAESDWNSIRFLDRMSCRASADFSKAFLKMTGFTVEDVLTEGKWDNLPEEVLLNLSKTEHLRWCAFFYSLGFSRMPDEIFDERSAKYIEEVKLYGKSKIKIQKDQNRYMHACLVDWEDLDELSEKYRKVTGDMTKDYKQDDTNNVLLFDNVLASSLSIDKK